MSADFRFDASTSLSGYLYQCKFALAIALQNLPTNPNMIVQLEVLDDISIENSDSAILVQTKHHANSPGDLTDHSPDLWKTLRVWIKQRQISKNLRFFLVTTGQTPKGSAASYLGATNRDIDNAITKLTAAAESSRNRTNHAAVTAFMQLSDVEKRELVSRITVFDQSSNMQDLDKLITEQIYWAVKTKNMDSFRSRLEEWWYRQIVIHISEPKPRKPIYGSDLEAKVDELRQQFVDDNLPVDSDIINRTVTESYRDHTFVQQLDLILISAARIKIAIRDYVRAYQQRSRWIREDLLDYRELESYETRLKEEWTIHFERMRADLGEAAAEKEKIRLAQILYNWAEDVDIPLRRLVQERFLVRGSFHILADNMHIGWHPDFEQKMTHLVGKTS